MRHERTLLLSQGYQPLKIISWKRAMCMMFLDKVEIVETYDWMINSARAQFSAPAVVRLVHPTKMIKHRIRFSRSNIYARDDKTCQYCTIRFGVQDLTLDHVIPKSSGGRTSWTNIVTCCIDCNRDKADRTPQQADMELLNKPVYPGILGSYHKYLQGRGVPNQWDQWLAIAAG